MFIIKQTWYELLKNELNSTEFKNFTNWLGNEYKTKIIYPKPENVFNAINYVLPSEIKVVIIGQDPYHQPNQAHGLCFSVDNKTNFPPSLINIFKELQANINCPFPQSGNLTPWAKQGVLLLNSVLTVEQGKPNSHKGKGWELITNKIIKTINNLNKPVVFMLWGNNAKAFMKLITNPIHSVLTATHPSPMSANIGGWFNNGCFKKANQILQNNGQTPINWEL